jgi:hypothetical protein
MTYDRASDGRWAWRWMGDGMGKLRLSLCDGRVNASAPAFRLPSAFRQIVLRHVPPRQIAEWERHGERSSWSRLQTPVLVIVVLGVAFLWITQPGLLNVTTGTIASVTAALPLVLRLLGRSPEEKSDKPGAEKAEKQGPNG